MGNKQEDIYGNIKVIRNEKNQWGVEDLAGNIIVPYGKYYDEYKTILSDVAEKHQLPIAYNLNFGHSMPRMILPLGGVAELNSVSHSIKINESMFASDKEEQIREKLHQSVDEERYVHSILVANQAKNLALHYGLDYEKAYIAGLAHDIAKRLSPEQEKYFVEKYNLDLELLSNEAKNYRHRLL